MARGAIKFFNLDRGFGFISQDEGDDVFVHISAARSSGIERLYEGDVLSFELSPDSQSSRPVAVDLVLVERGPRPRTPNTASRAPRHKSIGSGQGSVKWFCAEKGFGFLEPDNGGDDVFVHVRDVQRAGIQELKGGERIAYDLMAAPRTGKVSAGNLSLSPDKQPAPTRFASAPRRRAIKTDPKAV